MHTIKPDILSGPGDPTPRIITLTHSRHGDPFADVRCSEEGDVTLYKEYDTRYYDKSQRDNRHHHNIKGLDKGMLEFEGRTLVTFNPGWYAWTFHPKGVLLCYPERLDLVVLT